jgi:hypothetical protein
VARAIADLHTKGERAARAKIEATEMDRVIERARKRLERAKRRGDAEPTAAVILEEFGGKESKGSSRATPAASRGSTPLPRPSLRKERPMSLRTRVGSFGSDTPSASGATTPLASGATTPLVPRERVRLLSGIQPGARARAALATTLGEETPGGARKERVRLRLR